MRDELPGMWEDADLSGGWADSETAADRPTVTDNARAAARFWQRVDLDQGCWNWTGTRDQKGYGRARFGGKTTGAHRVAYELLVGPIPEELTIDHLCLNKSCVRPDHLEPVTRGENVRRWAETVTECPLGHPYTDDNTYRNPVTGKRACRACERLRSRKRDQRPVPCPDCGARRTRSNLARHRRAVHGGVR